MSSELDTFSLMWAHRPAFRASFCELIARSWIEVMGRCKLTMEEKTRAATLLEEGRGTSYVASDIGCS